MIKNTKEKDRQTQVKITFALMSILLKNQWLTKAEIAKELRKKGYERCEKTIYRLLKMLRVLKFNVMCDRSEVPHKYKGNNRNPFL